MMCSIRLEGVDIAVRQRARVVVPKPRREILKALSDLARIDVLINNAGLGEALSAFRPSLLSRWRSLTAS
jgi:hypothetical protein